MENTIPSPIMHKRMQLQTIVKVGVLSAVAFVLMLFEIPLWFAPSFYEIDFSEVIVLIGTFALGIGPGIAIELIKIVLNMLLQGTMTGGVGEFANFVIGCSLLVPAGLLYRYRPTFKTALVGLSLGTISMTIVGSLLNYFVLLPVYTKIMPLDAIVAMGNALNAAIVDLKSLVLFATAPFNLLKGILTTVVVLLLYKKLSPILKKKY